jgi:hypothetical protein
MGPVMYPETSVTNYQSTLNNITEERRYRLLRGGSLKSRIEKQILPRIFILGIR